MYTIVIERVVDNLINEVNKLIKDDWTPIGGVIQSHDAHWAQAMTKEDMLPGHSR